MTVACITTASALIFVHLQQGCQILFVGIVSLIRRLVTFTIKLDVPNVTDAWVLLALRSFGFSLFGYIAVLLLIGGFGTFLACYHFTVDVGGIRIFRQVGFVCRRAAAKCRLQKGFCMYALDVTCALYYCFCSVFGYFSLLKRTCLVTASGQLSLYRPCFETGNLFCFYFSSKAWLFVSSFVGYL